MKIQRKPILLLSTVILITVFQNCENSFQSLSDEVSMASDSMQSIAQSKIPSYIIQIDDSKDLSCPATGTTGSYKLSTENRQKIQLAESSSNQNRHLIIHPQPIEFATSNKSWTDIYRSNFSEIKNTFKKSESSFKIGTAMSLFALEGGSNICQIEQQLNDAFTQAEAHDIPLLVHVDFEWMIDLRPDIWDLNQNPDNRDKIEWSDWNTPIQKFVIFWNEAGIQRKAKVCFSSPEIREEVVKKGRFIAAVINKWRMRLVEKNKSYLFLGVDPGWETGIPDYRKVARAKAQGIDYELGYCSLHHEGYSQSNPPTNKNAVLADVVRKYAEMEAQIFFEAGLPRNKIFTHIIGNDGDINSGPYPGTETTQHSPIEVAFNSYSTPGFSLYPNSYYPELIKQHTQGQDWAITETAFDNFNHLNTFAGDPRLKSINIYSWDLVKINSQSVNALMSLMSYPLNTSTQPQTTPPVVTPTPTPVATPTPPAETNKVLIGAVESMSGSTISGWACIPGASILQIQIHAGDFYGAKNLIAVTTTGQSKSAMTTSCSGNAVSGFSYQFTDADKKNYEGKDIHIKAVSGDRELWLYKPAAYVVPHQPSTTLVGAVENMTGSIIYGWACFPSAASVQIQIYAGDFEGAKNLVALTSTGISKPAASSICSGNTLAGFSYQFNEADKRSYQGKAIHIKALYGGKEIWLYKPAAYIMPSVQ